MPQAERKTFSVSLPLELYDALEAQSERLKTPTSTLATQAIESWLRAQRAALLAEDIEAYARDMAGVADLERDLADAAETELLRATR